MTRQPRSFFVLVLAGVSFIALGGPTGCGGSNAAAPGTDGGGDAAADGQGAPDGNPDTTSGADGMAGETAVVPCTGIDDCGGVAPRCDTAKGQCAGCTADADCRGGLVCELATGLCRDCVVDGDCDAPTPVCDHVTWQCTAHCATDADCPKGDYPNRCDTARGICADCTATKGCKYCELDTFSCVGCLKDGDCPPAAPICGPSYACTPHCAADADCPTGLFCDAGKTLCVECVTNKHCRGGVCQPNQTCG